MRRVCAWCKTDLDENESEPGHNPVTHGICPACEVSLFREGFGGTELREFLASLSVPVLVVDENRRIQDLNEPALSMVGHSRDEVVDHLGGEVFNCIYAGLPAGCGNSSACSACTVRDTVLATFESGQSRTRVATTLRVWAHGEMEEIAFQFSTEKVGDRVLIQIDSAGDGSGN